MKEKITFGHNGKNTICYLEVNDKKYIGNSYCHDEDKENYRASIGEDIAKYRAYIKKIKDDIKELKIRRKEIVHMINVLTQSSGVNNKCRMIKILKKRKWNLDAEIADWYDAQALLRRAIAESANAAEIYAGLRSSNNKE